MLRMGEAFGRAQSLDSGGRRSSAIKVSKADGERHPADLMPKAMGRDTLVRLMSRMGVRHDGRRAVIAPELAEGAGGEEALAGCDWDSV